MTALSRMHIGKGARGDMGGKLLTPGVTFGGKGFLKVNEVGGKFVTAEIKLPYSQLSIKQR